MGMPGSSFSTEGFFGSLVLSMDGRLVVYASQATNLTPEDLGMCEDLLTFSGRRPCYGVFLYDRQTGLTELISYPNVSTGGVKTAAWFSSLKRRALRALLSLRALVY